MGCGVGGIAKPSFGFCGLRRTSHCLSKFGDSQTVGGSFVLIGGCDRSPEWGVVAEAPVVGQGVILETEYLSAQ